jgi:MSHA biogenesis protein MshG
MNDLRFFSSNGRSSVTLDECYLLTRQLYVLQKAGVPLLSSLQALQTQLPSGALKRILLEVHQDLLEGRTFSQSLGRHPRVFNPVFLGLIRVGEAGGLMENVLNQLAKLFEWEIELRHRLKEALQYPIIVLCTLSVAVTIMVIFVLPRFAQMFQSFRIPLPIQTRALIAISNLITRYGSLMALIAIGAGAGWWWYIHTDAGRLRWHTWKLHLPILGQVLLQLAMSRFARVTAILNSSGVSILETLALAGESVNNQYVKQRLETVLRRVKEGESLAGALNAEPLFPAIVVQMAKTGEDTGRVNELLESISEYYDQQVSYTVKRLITYIEPLLLVVVGLGVLLMATAVFVPMWDMALMG